MGLLGDLVNLLGYSNLISQILGGSHILLCSQARCSIRPIEPLHSLYYIPPPAVPAVAAVVVHKPFWEPNSPLQAHAELGYTPYTAAAAASAIAVVAAVVFAAAVDTTSEPALADTAHSAA